MLDLRDTAPAGGADFLWQVLGIAEDRVVPRDYSALLDRIQQPTTVLLAGQPLLPRRAIPRCPSLVDDESRRQLAAHPWVEVLEIADASHNITLDAPRTFLGAVHALPLPR